MADHRLLLLEFYFPDRYSQFRTRNFPFLLGQARQLGIEAQWLTCHMPPGQDSRDRYIIRLEAEARTRLLDAIGRFDPTHALVAERLEPSLAESLADLQPKTNFEDLVDAPTERLNAWPAAWLPDFLGLADTASDDHLVDVVEPAYACRSVNRPPGEPPPPVHVTAGIDCVYRRSLAKNQAFRGTAIPETVRGFGCSFCVGPQDLKYRFETPAVALALRQCLAALECPSTCLAKDRIVVSGAAVFAKIDAFFEEILKRAVPPSQFFFGCRIDEFASRAERIAGLLPALAAQGHSINIFNMGIENFSPAENQRLNKGLDMAVIERAAASLRRLESEFPGTFSFSQWGGFGLILFTPWTTCEDLAINLEKMGSFVGIDTQGFALTSKLQILTESAIRTLAERDGLLTDSFENFHHYDSGCIYRHDQREIPWRFAHPEVAALYEIAWRIEPLGDCPETDPLFRRIQALHARNQAHGGDAFDFFELALQLVREDPSLTRPRAILDGLESRIPTDPPPRPIRAELPSHDQPVRAEDQDRQTAASRRALALLTKLAAQGEALAGFEPRKVTAKTNDLTGPELVMEFIRGTEGLILHLLENRPDTPAFLQTIRFLLRYNESTPLEAADRERVTWLVAANLELFGLDLEATEDDSLDVEATEPVLDAGEIARLVTRARGKEVLEE